MLGRMALLALVALALMRPFWSPKAAANAATAQDTGPGAFGGERRDVVIVLDGSDSMGRKSGGTTPRDRPSSGPRGSSASSGRAIRWRCWWPRTASGPWSSRRASTSARSRQPWPTRPREGLQRPAGGARRGLPIAGEAGQPRPRRDRPDRRPAGRLAARRAGALGAPPRAAQGPRQTLGRRSQIWSLSFGAEADPRRAQRLGRRPGAFEGAHHAGIADHRDDLRGELRPRPAARTAELLVDGVARRARRRRSGRSPPGARPRWCSRRRSPRRARTP